MRSMQQQLRVLGTISAFAYRHRETKRHMENQKLCNAKKKTNNNKKKRQEKCFSFCFRYKLAYFSVLLINCLANSSAVI